MHSTRWQRPITRLSAVVAVATAITATTAVSAGTARAATTTPVATTITLVSSRPTANYGASGRIVATVRSAVRGAGIPTGSVDFSVDGGWYWNAPLDATGKAVLALTDLYPAFMPGAHAISATYSGDTAFDPSTTASPIVQTLVGISSPPVSTLSLNSRGKPVFVPRSFTMSSWNPVGCNVTITNTTPSTQVLAYGFPGAWKRLPFGTIAPGASLGVGVGLAQYTGYFTTMANTASYVAIHCR